jgi:ATP-dependent Lon protease
MVSYVPPEVPQYEHMPEPLIPLFPLEVVLLPGTPMPLHIFEDRYKEMVGAAIENKSEFGIVQAGEKGILNIGCTATVERVVNRYPDGRMDLVVVGRRRFEIILLDEEKQFLRAAVTFFDDEDEFGPASGELRALAIAGLSALNHADPETDRTIPDQRDPQLSFKIAWFLPDLALRQTMLALRSESERLKQLAEYLPSYVARVRRSTHVKRVAPTNGHGLIHVTEDGSV